MWVLRTELELRTSNLLINEPLYSYSPKYKIKLFNNRDKLWNIQWKKWPLINYIWEWSTHSINNIIASWKRYLFNRASIWKCSQKILSCQIIFIYFFLIKSCWKHKRLRKIWITLIKYNGKVKIERVTMGPWTLAFTDVSSRCVLIESLQKAV